MGEEPACFRRRAATELSTPPLIATTMGLAAKMVFLEIGGPGELLFAVRNDEHHHMLTDSEL